MVVPTATTIHVDGSRLIVEVDSFSYRLRHFEPQIASVNSTLPIRCAKCMSVRILTFVVAGGGFAGVETVEPSMILPVRACRTIAGFTHVKFALS